MQRFIDIVLSGIGLLLLSLLLLPIVVLLKITGEKEVFFKQERIGRDGKVFKLYKFATMLKSSPEIGTRTVTIKDDPRVLPVGRILRKTKINELPQLINVLQGDMSLIGPRPLTIERFNSYSKKTREIIKHVRPGLSGIGSIIFRGEENMLDKRDLSVEFYDQLISPYKGALEEWYVNHQGLRTYFLVIVTTIIVVFFPRSTIPWLVFRRLPVPPNELKQHLNYPY